MKEVAMNDPKKKQDVPPYQDTEFDNPFNTTTPAVCGIYTSPDGVVHKPALSPDKFVALKFVATKGMGEKQAEFKFALPHPSDHTGCLPGQYVQIRVKLAGSEEGKFCHRFFSPVSGTSAFGQITLVMKFESRGQLSQHFKKIKPGMTSEMRLFLLKTVEATTTLPFFFEPWNFEQLPCRINVLLAKASKPVKPEQALYQNNIFFPGDAVDFKGPWGGFEYTPNSIKHLSLLASGGGATPCIQLVRDFMADPSDQTAVRMIYYADKEQEFIYKNELDTYAAKDPKRFGLFYTMKDGIDFDNWKGGDGYIDGDMIASMIPPSKQTESHKILVCGGPSMIITVLQNLHQLGYPSEDIFVYGQFGVEQLRSVYGRNAKLSAHRVEWTIKTRRLTTYINYNKLHTVIVFSNP